MANQNFDKFINKKVKGAKKKEQIKQEKKMIKKEREAFFIAKKQADRAAKKLQNDQQGNRFDKKTFRKDQPEKQAEAKPFKKTYAPAGPGSKPTKRKPAEKSARKSDIYLKKEDANKDGRKSPGSKKEFDKKGKAQRPERPFTPAAKSFKDRNSTADQPKRMPIDRKVASGGEKFVKKEGVPANAKKDDHSPAVVSRKFDKPAKAPVPDKTPYSEPSKEKQPAKTGRPQPGKRPAPDKTAASDFDIMPLNKFIAHGGVCSRRDAGELVKKGAVSVNGQQVTDPAYKVQETDKVVANGKQVTRKAELVYILLNKPKDFITTVDDPQGRKTVLDIVKSATQERIYPVGRLDRNTSGVLLLTNDGDLAQQLTHPSFEVKKIYEAKLNKALSKNDFDQLLNGITLEDGEVHADAVAYADSKDKSVIGIEIHSGKNRVVRRMFEHLGYDVRNLDRVMFANLTKKNVDRGKWRFLSEKEVRLLKFFNKSKKKN